MLCKHIGKPALAEDERFETNEKRVENRNELSAILNELFTERTTDEWIEAFEGSGLPYAPINTMLRVFDHPQTRARDMVTEIRFDAAKSGKLSLVGKLWKVQSSFKPF